MLAQGRAIAPTSIDFSDFPFILNPEQTECALASRRWCSTWTAP